MRHFKSPESWAHLFKTDRDMIVMSRAMIDWEPELLESIDEQERCATTDWCDCYIATGDRKK